MLFWKADDIRGLTCTSPLMLEVAMNCKNCGDVLRNNTYGSFCEDCYCDALLGYTTPISGTKLSIQAKKMYEKAAEKNRKKGTNGN